MLCYKETFRPMHYYYFNMPGPIIVFYKYMNTAMFKVNTFQTKLLSTYSNIFSMIDSNTFTKDALKSFNCIKAHDKLFEINKVLKNVHVGENNNIALQK
jgi:hypothetical protein